MSTAYIALGSNLGDRLNNLKQAVIQLRSMPGTKVVKLSSIYETAPVGGPRQNTFLNACAELQTVLTPTLLMETMLDIEDLLGRVRKVRWGPRIIDLDLLIYDKIRMCSPLLELPHPRMAERNFVLIPLADINPTLVIPGMTKSVKQLISKQVSTESVELYLSPGWDS